MAHSAVFVTIQGLMRSRQRSRGDLRLRHTGKPKENHKRERTPRTPGSLAELSAGPRKQDRQTCPRVCSHRSHPWSHCSETVPFIASSCAHSTTNDDNIYKVALIISNREPSSRTVRIVPDGIDSGGKRGMAALPSQVSAV